MKGTASRLDPHQYPGQRTGAWAILITLTRESSKPDYPGYMHKHSVYRLGGLSTSGALKPILAGMNRGSNLP